MHIYAHTHTYTHIYIHILNSNEMVKVKARLELYKDTMCYFEQILEAAPNKTATYIHSHKTLT